MPDSVADEPICCDLFAEHASAVIVTCAAESVEKIREIVGDSGLVAALTIGSTISERVELTARGQLMISEPITNLLEAWRGGLPDALESTFHRELSAVGQA